ncbi:MAG: GTP-binding protein [Candidatus Pacebacteria bacterium]|nr:GTP-binding protein [Candidatus Paceibacterota bacterium]
MENQNQDLKFVIVGHVDHGKSTLIGRLLYDTNSLPPDKMEEIKKTSEELGRVVEFAFIMDNLQEEREQGITIDTAQTFFRTPKRQYVIIDAPGHVEFVKNMLTGASLAEAAILIVDAAEGVKEQTKRHSYLLSLLGIKQVIVVVNKMDLVDYKEEVFDKIKGELTEFLANLNVQPKLFIPIAALKGDNVAKRSDNMKWYSGQTVLSALDDLEDLEQARDQGLILPVQEIYKLEEKRYVLGRVEAGEIKPGQTIKVLPSGQTTVVKTVEKFQQENLTQAQSGENIGLTTVDPLFIERGNVLCENGKEPLVKTEFSANLFWLSHEPLAKDEPLIVKIATQESIGEVIEIKKRFDSSTMEILEQNAGKLQFLEAAEVTIKAKKPLALAEFSELAELGKFVLIKNDNVVAGGIVAELKNN